MDDIVILEDRGTEQLPHLRPDCTIHIFQEGNKRKFCCKCYCFVCDTVVAQCSRWMEHCIANPKDSHWRALRSVYRAKKPTHSSVDAHKPSSIPNVDGIKIEGFSDGKRTYGWVKCFSGKINNVDSQLIRLERTHHDPSVIELISKHNIRKTAKLSDGSKVTIKIPI